MSATREAPENLEVSRAGVVISEPHILEITLASRGRKDIPTSDFDENKPLQIDAGTVILDIVKIKSEPESTSAPKVIYEDNILSIGPSLIRKRQRIGITLLIDGKPTLSHADSLIDVKVRQQRPQDPDLEKALIGPMSLAAVGVIAGVAANTMIQFTKGAMSLTTGWLGVVLLCTATICMFWGIGILFRFELRQRHHSRNGSH
jgi:hypothetical protein